MRYALSVVAAVASVSTPVESQSVGMPDVVIANQIGVDNEPALTLPPGQFVVGFISNPLPLSVMQTVWGAELASGGLAPMAVPTPPIPPPYLYTFDPALTSDSLGDSYMAFIATVAGPGSASAMCVSKYTGAAWLPPVPLAQDPAGTGPLYRFNDRCDITSGFVVSPHVPTQEAVVATWIKDRGTAATGFADAFVSVSTDFGATFSPALSMTELGVSALLPRAHSPHVVIDAAGKIHVFWQDLNVSLRAPAMTPLAPLPCALMMDTSVDGGYNFAQDRIIGSYMYPPAVVASPVFPGTSPWAGYQNGAAIPAAHPTDPSRLYVVYAASNVTSDPDLYLVRSHDGGSSWVPPVLVPTTPPSGIAAPPVAAQIMPQMAIQPNGDLVIAWWDNRGGVGWDVYIIRAMETTSGAGSPVVSFSGDYRVSNTSYLPPSNGSGPWLGEYFALEVDAVNAYLAFPGVGPSAPPAGPNVLYADVVPIATIL
ncbi:MAG: hypothetical protein AAF628_37955 [Planctomycetota bacterium]